MSDLNPKPVVFLAFANNHQEPGGYLRHLSEEARQLRAALERAEQAELCDVVVRANATANDIFKVFQNPRLRDRVAVFHYGGHANGFQLLLESAEGNVAAADAGGLAAFLAQQKGLRLVFLNGCSTQLHTDGLLDANIPAVISTSEAIDDRVATDFAFQFYQGLSGGAAVGTAYKEAQSSVQTATGKDIRALYFGSDSQSEATTIQATDRWPWNLYLREGSESADQWSLPLAVNDPLFGLPPVPKQDLPASPYRQLNWFRREDAEVFFGRGREIRGLYDRLTAPGNAPIVLLFGQSGVGKSSLLDAGLIPRLESQYDVAYERRADEGVLGSLRQALQLPPQCGLSKDAWRARETQLGRPVIVILDQVEELFTRPIEELPDELERFLNFLNDIFSDVNRRPQGKLVLAFRKEWLAELESQIGKYGLSCSQVFLERLGRQGIMEAVKGPTSTVRLQMQYGLQIDHDLPEIIADDLLEDRDSSVAPTLQILLTKLWRQAKQINSGHPPMTQELYQQLRRNGILLRDFLDQQIEEIHRRRPNAVDSGLLLDVIALHTTPLGTADQCSLKELQDAYSHVSTVLPDLLQHCQDLYVLSIADNSANAGSQTTRLAHDTIAPLVRQRFEQSDKPGQRARRILDARVRECTDGRRLTPLDLTDLKTVEDGQQGTQKWSSQEEQLVRSSRAVRARRRVTWGLVASSIAILAGVAGWKWYEAETNLRFAQFSVKDHLSLYLDWPRWASEIAAAETAQEARDAYNALVESNNPDTLRLITPAISEIALHIDELIQAWEQYDGPYEVWQDQHPAAQCRLRVRELVRRTIAGLELTLAADSSIDNATKDLRRQMERDLFNRALTDRARQVTRNIASATPDRAAMSVWRKEFERLYWAELWWVELQHNELIRERDTTLEVAMYKYREEGLHSWDLDKLTADSRRKLSELADTVGECCDELLTRSAATR
ncbi:nSTAND1 domain-containing NTPase [Allorhodopirellula heiligendammensis]|uniref:CHAT domain protein n=1 Tax=Allorhodopirellula heiligendammensis TaxID=2714739 RepID=A0A5C6BDF8_9BACT|nr:CHAT domain-containing protein [Allorhodopirellula heiligendammensis]TWU10143.1 CHAT domain protein [Allorhodopirellula heiligendammensis]